MSRVTLIIGGTRSGKSRFAESLAEQSSAPRCYLATALAGDREMAERISRHQARRGTSWQTVEEPRELLATLRDLDGRFSVILVDCLTLWLSNILLAHDEDPLPVRAAVTELAAALPSLTTPLLIVSNEVGMGIVPENRLARLFRDLAGEANELLARAGDEVYVVFSGLPLKLKG